MDGSQMKTICAAILLILALSATSALPGQSADEKAVWKLEHAYWKYVKALDLDRYKSLWHPAFVGWPSSSATPVRVNHVTDWITQARNKGLKLRSYTLKPAASQATENVVITHYWLTEHWADSSGRDNTETIKLCHTWLRVPGGWQIIGGMAAPISKADQTAMTKR
jgi:Domain of unknown function (DUF4440)